MHIELRMVNDEIVCYINLANKLNEAAGILQQLQLAARVNGRAILLWQTEGCK